MSAPPGPIQQNNQRSNTLAVNESSFHISGPALRSDEAPTPRGTLVVSLAVFVRVESPIQVYTDASCRGNYASGVGIYVESGHELNLSQALPGPVHTSVFAELRAANIALERVRTWSGYE